MLMQKTNKKIGILFLVPSMNQLIVCSGKRIIIQMIREHLIVKLIITEDISLARYRNHGSIVIHDMIIT